MKADEIVLSAKVEALSVDSLSFLLFKVWASLEEENTMGCLNSGGHTETCESCDNFGTTRKILL